MALISNTFNYFNDSFHETSNFRRFNTSRVLIRYNKVLIRTYNIICITNFCTNLFINSSFIICYTCFIVYNEIRDYFII